MAAYEATYVYAPFLYLYLVVAVYGGMYHSLLHVQPFILTTFLLLNTAVMARARAEPRNGKEFLQRQMWRVVCVVFFGVLLNNVHNEMFRDFHLQGAANVVASALYVAAYAAARRAGAAPRFVHALFLFVPLRRMWQGNLYVYVAGASLAGGLLFRRIRADTLISNEVLARPLETCFMYLRVHEGFALLALAHAGWLYYDFATRPHLEAAERALAEAERAREPAPTADI